MRAIALLTLALLLPVSAGAAPACDPNEVPFDVVFGSNLSPVSLGDPSTVGGRVHERVGIGCIPEDLPGLLPEPPIIFPQSPHSVG